MLPEVSDPGHQSAVVNTIGPDLSQLAEPMRQGREHDSCAIAVLRACRMHRHEQEQTEGIDQNVSLAPVNPLASVEAALITAAIGSLDALTVEDRSRWLPLVPFLLPHPITQAVVDVLPGTREAPGAKVTVDGLPWRILARQTAPRTTRPDQVKDRIDDQARISLAFSASWFGGRNQGFDILPFSVGQVAWVELVAHTLMLSKPTGASKTRSESTG